MNYGLISKFIAQDNKRDELAKILLRAAELLKQNEQCISYVVSVTDEPNDVWVSEIWRSKEAHSTSLGPEDIRNLIMTARPLIKDMQNRTELEVLGGKGL